MPLLSVVIPVFNERATVAAVIERVRATGMDLELIVVDDGSTDGTCEILRSMEQDERTRVVLRERNAGKGAALADGFAVATGDIVIVQDADLEYDPVDFPALVAPIAEGRADVVFGSRFAGGRAHRVLYFWHAVGNRLLTLVSNMLTDLNMSDMECGYKAFRREVIQGVRLRSRRFGFEPEITVKMARGGWRIYEVPVGYAGRTYAEGKKIGWRDGVRAIYCIVRYSPVGERYRRRTR